ncbi:MAG: histidine kinase [Saprospiraceae bacterium]|nr:histidine kinase [Saprospiraceae bacterium]
MKFGKLPLPYWAFILIGFLFGLLLAGRSYLPYLYWDETNQYNWQRAAIPHLVNYTFWGILVPVVYHFSQKYPLNDLSRRSVQIKAFLISLAVATFHEIATNVLWLGPLHLMGIEKITMEMVHYVLGSLAPSIISRLIEYWLLFFIFAAIDYYKMFKNKQLELVKLENQLSNAELNALRLQLHPHFLFNTLNTISSLMEISIKDAQKIVSKLGILLRTLLDKERRNLISLSEELNFIKSYLDIEQVRFHDRLKIIYQIEEEVLDALVPALILQPLVENAIKHGFGKQIGEGSIALIAKKVESGIQLIVQDDGKGAEQTPEELLQSGIGLRNVKERLELLYRDKASLRIFTIPGKGFEVQITLPNEPNGLQNQVL